MGKVRGNQMAARRFTHKEQNVIMLGVKEQIVCHVKESKEDTKRVQVRWDSIAKIVKIGSHLRAKIKEDITNLLRE